MSKQPAVGSKALAIVRHFYPSVSKVNDADEPITVEVTAKDVKESHRKDSTDCALAVACKRNMDLQGVIIAKSTAYLVKVRTATRYEVPTSVQKEIVAFDRGAEFAIGAYQLRPFSKTGRLGKHNHGRSDGGNGPHTDTAHKRFRHITEGVRASLGREE
jgi:hypothetical protein